MNCPICASICGTKEDSDACLISLDHGYGIVHTDGFLDSFGLRHLADHLDGLIDKEGNVDPHKRYGTCRFTDCALKGHPLNQPHRYGYRK